MSKNIHDLSDDEFDDLFRESAEKSDISFDPDAWNKMSKKLDAATAPPSGSGKGGSPLTKWGLPLVALLLLLITGTYFFLRKPSGAVTGAKVNATEKSLKQSNSAEEKDVATDKVGTENQENAKENSISKDRAQADIITDVKGGSGKANKASNSAENRTVKTEKIVSKKSKQNQVDSKGDLAKKTPSDKQEKVITEKITLKTETLSADEKVAGKEKSHTYKTSKKSSDLALPASSVNTAIAQNKSETKSKSAVESEKKGDNILFKSNNKRSELSDDKTTVNQKQSAKTEPISSTNAAVGNVNPTAQSQSIAVDSTNAIEKMQWASVNTLTPIEYLFNINLKLPNVHFESPALAPVSIPRPNTAFRRGLNIRLALSPDFSFIPSNKIFKVGNNWAAILEYRFNNRFSIQSGIIRSLKYYGALPNQYEWNAYWTMPSPLKDIDATCKMLDIPLNIRYDISQKPNSRWFVGAGFTSYIMLKEEYRYNYENPSDPNIKRKSWEGKTGGYPFSVLNLSAGYERQLFRRLTFQAEPFYKAPLGKVGYGKVRLATAGVFLSAKYPF